MRSDQTIDLGFTKIPITVIKGAKPGPVLALTAGIHGYEYPPILALQRLRVGKLAGTLIIVHVANMPSFLGARGRHGVGTDRARDHDAGDR
jgi:predicted deacylase